MKMEEKLRLSATGDSKPDNFQINARICRLVQNYPCMYDRSHPHYLKKDVVDKAWVLISKEMDDSIPSCKERWRNIRTSFARSINVNKIPSSANRTKPYYLHEELQFLARHITPGVPVSRRPNYYGTIGDEKSEMIEVPIGEESFDGFAAMAAEKEAEEEEQRQRRSSNEVDSKQERAPSSRSSEDGNTMSGREEQGTPCHHASVEDADADVMGQKLPVQSSPLPLVQYAYKPQQQQQQQQQLPVPYSIPQQQQQQQQQIHQQQQQQIQQQLPPPLSLPPPPPPPAPVETMEVEPRIVAEVPVLPLYPFKKRLRTAESMICAEVEPERDVKPQPSELCTPDPDFDAAFLQGLLPEMKAMDFRQKIIFKKRIYEVIGEIFESQPNASTSRRTSQAHSANYNACNTSSNYNSSSNQIGTSPLMNGYSAAYTNGCTSNSQSQAATPTPTANPTPTATPTPASSPNASGYASPLNMFNTVPPTTTTSAGAISAAAAAASLATVNATDLALIRRLSTLLQSPAVVSSTSTMAALPKTVGSISSTVRGVSNSTPTTAASSGASVSAPTSASGSASVAATPITMHRGAMTRSSAHLLRSTKANGSTPTSSTSFGSPSSNGSAVSHAVKQELLDD